MQGIFTSSKKLWIYRSYEFRCTVSSVLEQLPRRNPNPNPNPNPKRVAIFLGGNCPETSLIYPRLSKKVFKDEKLKELETSSLSLTQLNDEVPSVYVKTIDISCSNKRFLFHVKYLSPQIWWTGRSTIAKRRSNQGTIKKIR